MSALNIYKLTRNDEILTGEVRAVIVIAATSGDAREMAALAEGPQLAGFWHLRTTSVELIGRAAPALIGQVMLAEKFH